jgi:fructokinase
MYIHGLLAAWPLDKTLEHAQAFASRVVGQRGAISTDIGLYRAFTD